MSLSASLSVSLTLTHSLSYVCVCVCTHMGVFLDYSPLYVLRLDLSLKAELIGWVFCYPVSFRDLLVFILPAAALVFGWMLGWDLGSSCLCGRHFTDWVISLGPQNVSLAAKYQYLRGFLRLQMCPFKMAVWGEETGNNEPELIISSTSLNIVLVTHV